MQVTSAGPTDVSGMAILPWQLATRLMIPVSKDETGQGSSDVTLNSPHQPCWLHGRSSIPPPFPGHGCLADIIVIGWMLSTDPSACAEVPMPFACQLRSMGQALVMPLPSCRHQVGEPQVWERPCCNRKFQGAEAESCSFVRMSKRSAAMERATARS